MAMRQISMNVSGIERRLRMDETIWRRTAPQAVMVAVSEMLPAYVEMAVPKKSGALQKSAEVKVWPTRVRMWFTSPYAGFVDEGYGPSPGRFVPKPLERRLTMEGALRRAVFKSAMKQGARIEHAAVALTTPIGQHPAFIGKYISGRFKAPESGKRTELGRITISSGLTGKQRKSAVKHELWHAVQWASGAPFQEEAIPEIEAGARKAERVKEADIGTHPGYKGAHFSEEIANMMKEDMKSIVETVLKRIWEG